MKFKTILVVALILLLAVGGFLYLKKYRDQTTNSNIDNSNLGFDVDTANEFVVHVVADKGILTPKDFNVPQTKSLILKVQAVDKDYSFEVEDYPRIDFTMQKGEETSILIEALGVGEYTYTCGTGCKGTITVSLESD